MQSSAPALATAEILRDGDAAASVFLFPGAGGAVSELAGLAQGLGPAWRIVGISLDDAGLAGRDVPDLAAAACATIRQMQPDGPYRLLGYSFGGLVALEAAHLLREAGAPVRPPILIDCYFDARFWPRKLWLRAQLRRTSLQLKAIRKLDFPAAVRQFFWRGGRLLKRLLARLGLTGPVRRRPPAENSALAHNMAAMARHEPRFFPGEVMLLQSSDDSLFGATSADLWSARCAMLTLGSVAGDHLTLLRDPASAEQLSHAVQRSLETMADPLALLVTTKIWPSTGQLATALAAAAFRVAVIGPPGHPLLAHGNLRFAMPLLGRERRLPALIARIAPDVILPCDEIALGALGRLGLVVSPPSRADLIATARQAGLAAPLMRALNGPEDLQQWIGTEGLPAVLKTDGSWGGMGVVIARDTDQARRDYARLAAGSGLIRSVKRALFNHEPDLFLALLAGRRPVVNAQTYVVGSDANIAVACWQGRLLASISVEVLETSHRYGPATVVKVIDHPEMLETARRVVAQYRLGGLVGMDFILEAAQDGGPSRAHLIELNARVTPSVVLALGAGRDPVKALRSAFPGTAPDAGPAIGAGLVIDLRAPGASAPSNPQTPWVDLRHPNIPVLTPVQAVLDNATASAAVAPTQAS